MARKEHKIYTYKQSARKGCRDGRGFRWMLWPIYKKHETVYPVPDQVDQAAFEEELHRCCEENVSSFSEAWKDYDLKAKPQYCQAKREFELAQDAWVDACYGVEPVRAAYDRAKLRYDSLPVPAWPAWAEWVVTILAIALEGPGLAYAYQLMGASLLETYLMAALAVITVPFAAVLWGQKLRKSEHTGFDRGMLIAIPAVFMVALIGFTMVRVGVFEAAKLAEAFETTLSNGAVSAIFFTVNLLSFMLCSVVSYRSGHKNPEEHRRLSLHLSEASTLLEQETKDVNQTKAQRDKAELNFLRMREVRRKEFEGIQVEAINLIEQTEYLIQVYRTHNINARPDRKAPPCFLGPMRIVQLPKELQTEALDWDCPRTIGRPLDPMFSLN